MLTNVSQSNVLISDDGKALLSDFGWINWEYSAENIPFLSYLGDWPRWQPNDQRDGLIGPPVDIWAWGMTSFEV